MVSLVFGALVILWLTRKQVDTGLFTIPGWAGLFSNPGFMNDGTSAIAMSVLLFLIPSRSEPGTRILEWEAVKKLPWGIVLLFGGGFALAQGFEQSGLSSWIGGRLEGLSSFHPAVVIGAICFMATFLTELTSNTATAQIFLPVLASLSVAANIHPLAVMVPATISFSFAFMLPVATPPNAIVFGAGRLRIIDMAKAGLFMNLAGVVIITISAMFLIPAVLGFEIGALPAWALGK